MLPSRKTFPCHNCFSSWTWGLRKEFTWNQGSLGPRIMPMLKMFSNLKLNYRGLFGKYCRILDSLLDNMYISTDPRDKFPYFV